MLLDAAPSGINYEKPSIPVYAHSHSELRYQFSNSLFIAPVAGEFLTHLPYRFIFAIATLDSVLVYDTQQFDPVAFVTNIHYAPLTDIAWSSDGSALFITSTDGYCSSISFDDSELGIALSEEEKLRCRKVLSLDISISVSSCYLTL